MGRNRELNKLRKRKSKQDQYTQSEKGRERTAWTGRDERCGRDEEGPKALWRRLAAFIGTYPFLLITVVLVLSRLLPFCIAWLRLRSGLVGLVVPVDAEKQVLILGTLGSGTTYMSRELTRLHLEVGHESSDSVNEFCRDGTVSWAHGIRYLSGTPNLSLLCDTSRHSAYRSTMFRESSNCSYIFRLMNFQSFATMSVRPKEQLENKLRTQVRHPLQTVATLAYKSSSTKEGRGRDCTKAKQQLATIMALLPRKVVRQNLGEYSEAFLGFDWSQASSTCVQAWAWYWVIFNRTMLGKVDGWYRIEDTTPSQVAVMAGFWGVGIDEAVAEMGEGERLAESGGRRGRRMEVEEGFQVTWEDIAPYPGGLLREMSDLAVELGYIGAPGLPGKIPTPTEQEETQAGTRRGWGWGSPSKRGDRRDSSDGREGSGGWRGLLGLRGERTGLESET